MLGDETMSLKEYDRQRHQANDVGINLGRSASFNTFHTSRGNQRASMTTWSTPVLGEQYRSPRANKRPPTAGYKKAVKLPKVPRPARTLQVFSSVKDGIRECISATEDDCRQLRASEELSSTGASPMGVGRLFELEKQLKAAERYKKRLEFHLAKIDELEEHYLVQQRLREDFIHKLMLIRLQIMQEYDQLQGAKTMAQAYVSYTGSNKAEPLLNVKCGYKECTQTMCAIEAQLENLLGTFHMKMKGLVGFARLMPGDVFEITLRHGHQKWKTKSRINVNTQSWDSDMALFKALVGEVLTIKAVEVKGLGKHVQLGLKNCETRDLFSSHPQMMTVSVNANGSIKLSVLITWNPLEGIDEQMSIYEPPPRSGGTPKRRQVHSVIEGATLNNYLNGIDSASDLSSEASSSERDLLSREQPHNNRYSVPSFPSSINMSNYHSFSPHHHTTDSPSGRPNSIAVMDTINENHGDKYGKAKMFDMKLLSESIDQGIGGSTKAESSNLEDALFNLKSTLEDYQGQYPELQKLELQIRKLDKLLKKCTGAGSPRASDVSISIERALGAFDFLESEDYIDGYASGDNLSRSRRSSLDALEAKCTLSPESTTKTADSGIESIAHRLSEDHGQETSLDSSPEPPSTGNEQVDVSILWHVQYAEKLLEHLGSFGPLKCKEIYSLDKLQRQATIMERLLRIAQSGNQIPSLQDVMTEATRNRHLQQFWVKAVEGTVLYTNSERFLSQLERCYGDDIREKYDISAMKVFKVVIARILDIPVFDPECSPCPNITMHQFFNFFSDEQHCDIDEFLDEMAGEMWVTGRLRSGNTDIVIKTLLTFKDTIPPPESLRVVALLLIADDPEVRTATSRYLQGIGKSAQARDKAIIVYVESLEDPSPEVRCGACVALCKLQATESLEQLTYLCQTETSPQVKQRARETLVSFGDRGRKAYEETQLTSHGFQGVNVRL